MDERYEAEFGEGAEPEVKKIFNKGIMDLRQIALLEMSGQECRLNRDYAGWCDVLEALISKLSSDIKKDDVEAAEQKVEQARIAIKGRNTDVARKVLHDTEKIIFEWEHRININIPSTEVTHESIDQPDMHYDDDDEEDKPSEGI